MASGCCNVASGCCNVAHVEVCDDDPKLPLRVGGDASGLGLGQPECVGGDLWEGDDRTVTRRTGNFRKESGGGDLQAAAAGLDEGVGWGRKGDAMGAMPWGRCIISDHCLVVG